MKKDWKVEKIGDVCEVIAGQSPEGTYYNDKGKGLPFYQGKKEFTEKFIGEPTTWTTKVTKEAQAGDILMSVRAPVGPVNFATQKICIGRGLAAIRAGTSIDKEFLFYFLLKHEEEIEGNAGAVFSSINKTQIESIEIPIPSLPEQQRIVSLLDETFAGLAQVHTNAERNLVNAHEVFEAVLEESVAGKDSRKWNITTVGEVSEHSLGKMLDKQKNRGNFQKYLRNINVRWFDFDLSDVNEMRFLEEEKEKYTAIKGDLLICEGGYPGRAAIWEEDYPIYFQKAIHRVRFEKNLTPKWFLYCLYSADLSGRLKKYLTGTGIQHFTGQALDRFEFPVPPLEEQRAIVKRLDGLAAETSRLEAVYQSKLEAVEELRKSVLGKAFEGEL